MGETIDFNLMCILMMINKIKSSVNQNYWLESSNTTSFKQTNQNLIKVPKVLS